MPVVVPDALAGDVLRRLLRDLTAEVRSDGGEIAGPARYLLWQLHAADLRHRAPAEPFELASGVAPVGRLELSTAEAAQLLECSPQWVRHLLATGQLVGRRAGWAWLVDAADLDRYRHRRCDDRGHPDHAGDLDARVP